MTRTLLALALVAACTKAPPSSGAPGNTDTTGDKAGVAPRPAAKATVTLTSVTFADDCGGSAPTDPPALPAAREPGAPITPAPRAVAADMPAQQELAAKRRCEQTAMQLAIAAKDAADVRITSVEVFDEKGALLGTLTASKPTRWAVASSTYEAWNEKVAAGELANVSYVLSQPEFVNRWDSHDRTYTVKVVASVGGVAQPLQTSVMVVAQPAPVPT